MTLDDGIIVGPVGCRLARTGVSVASIDLDEGATDVEADRHAAHLQASVGIVLTVAVGEADAHRCLGAADEVRRLAVLRSDIGGPEPTDGSDAHGVNRAGADRVIGEVVGQEVEGLRHEVVRDRALGGEVLVVPSAIGCPYRCHGRRYP